MYGLAFAPAGLVALGGQALVLASILDVTGITATEAPGPAHQERRVPAQPGRDERVRAVAAPQACDVLGERAKLERWRVFFLACAELFGYGGGRERGIAHFRFKRRGAA